MKLLVVVLDSLESFGYLYRRIDRLGFIGKVEINEGYYFKIKVSWEGKKKSFFIIY